MTIQLTIKPQVTQSVLAVTHTRRPVATDSVPSPAAPTYPVFALEIAMRMFVATIGHGAMRPRTRRILCDIRAQSCDARTVTICTKLRCLARYAIARPSICPSVTRVDQSETVEVFNICFYVLCMLFIYFIYLFKNSTQ